MLLQNSFKLFQNSFRIHTFLPLENLTLFPLGNLIPFATTNSYVVSLLSLGAEKVSDDGSVKAGPTFEYTHTGRDKNGTPRPHPCIHYDRSKADPIPHNPSAAETLRLASASLVRVLGGSRPDCLQVLGGLCVLLLKLLFPRQRHLSLQAAEEFFNLYVVASVFTWLTVNYFKVANLVFSGMFRVTSGVCCERRLCP